MKKLLCILGVFGVSFSFFSGVLSNARKVKPSRTIICSSDGEGGGVAVIKALSELKKGMGLKLLPGDYESEIRITQDKIIITGDPTKPCNVMLKIYGKGCVVKNLWVRKLSASNSVVILDSLIDFFYA